MDAGADELFSSPTDVSNSMPCELSWSTPEELGGPWVFWSRQNNELQRLLPNTGLSRVDTTSFVNWTITEKIKAVLKLLPYHTLVIRLFQVWAPVQVGDRIYLTTANQPFGLERFHKGLCSYRKLCVSSLLVPTDVNEMGDEEENNHGPLARVFRRGVREYCGDVSSYLNKEYPQRNYALKYGVQSYLALPFFERHGQQCVGVLEVLSTSAYDSLNQICFLEDKLEKMDLTCHLCLPLNSLRDAREIDKAYQAMTDIRKGYQLPLAQLWIASCTTRYIYRIDSYNDWTSFEVCSKSEGKGIVGKAFSSRSACFCSNVSELSINVYPSIPNARKLGLTGCFAVCLQSTVNDNFYILEFFLPSCGLDYGDPRNFLSMLVASLKIEIQSSMGAHVQTPGEKLFVEVIKTSDDELDSFEICATTHSGSTSWDFKHPDGKDMKQHDARNNISAEQNDVVGPSATPELLQNSLLQRSVIEPDSVNKDISINGFGALTKSTAAKALDQKGNNNVKGPWSKEEDELITVLVNILGPNEWSKIAPQLPGRTGKQCQERWQNHLNPNKNMEAWTQEEELALIRAHQIYGNQWAELTKFLPGRTDNAIENHWNTSVKKKLHSYLASGLFAEFQGLHTAIHPNQSMAASARPELLQNSLLQQSVMEPPDALNKDTDIATGKQCDISMSGFDAVTEKSTARKAVDQGGNNVIPIQGDGSSYQESIRREMQQDSSCQESTRTEMQPDSSCQESNRVPDHIDKGNLVIVDRDASAGARKQGQENVSTKQNMGAKSVPHSLPQQSLSVNDINGERSVGTEQGDANGSRKEGKIWTFEREYGISREVLEQHSRKKLKDVAAILGVSRSTLKRICRRHDIHRWPPCKAKRFRPSVNPQVSFHATQRQIKDQSLRNRPLRDLALEICSVSKAHTIPNVTEEQDRSSIMVKATYRDDTIKFPLSLSSGKVNLEEEVAIRLNLSVGSFKIKYLDEDEDWILLTCDADLRTCINTLKSLGKTTIKMRIF